MADNTLTHAYTNTSTKTEILQKRRGHTVRGEREREREQSLVTRLTTHRGGGRVEGRGERMFFFLFILLFFSCSIII